MISERISSDILLVGQPNVGKSVLFSRITGIKTISSNYSGTTVSYSSGTMFFGDFSRKIIDAPGTYSLEPLDDAARVTIDLIDEAKIIVNVVDATHLERNLSLTMELIEQGKPVVMALNMSDEARHKGIEIDIDKLSQRLGIPVIATTARTGDGVRELIIKILGMHVEASKIKNDNMPHPGHHPHIPHHEKDHNEALLKEHAHIEKKAVWEKIGNIIADVQVLKNHKHTALEVFEDMSVHPVFGLIIALLVMIVSFSLIRLIGESLISVLEKLFNGFYLPVIYKLSYFLHPGSFIDRILIGGLVEGKINLLQSYGLLTSGIFIPLGVVLPYVFSFYFVVSIIEDTGYLPRLAIFLDGIMHKIGLHGYAIIPTILGFGCNVPGILATRILETKHQRFVVATLISISVPCVALQAMIIGSVGKRGLLPLLTVYGVLLLSWFIIGFILKFVAGEYQPELLIEIPPYRIPDWKALFSKMWTRSFGFIKEALPIIMVSILFVDILYQTEVFNYIADIAAPVVHKLWGMPKESIIPLLIGILRKDAAVAMFPATLTTKQLVTGCVILSMFFPCVATLVILVKELGIKYAAKSILIMLVAVTIAGMLVNLLY